jgi:plasmid stabilization system protein ParE
VTLRYTRRAAAELEEVLAYINERSPLGARHVQARIQAIVNLLQEHPNAGQLTSNGRLRRMVASPYPYLIFYEVTEGHIVIHGLRHAARRPPTLE